jgi:hypothetical protein
MAENADITRLGGVDYTGMESGRIGPGNGDKVEFSFGQ